MLDQRITVLVVDDNEPVRTAVVAMLRRASDIVVCGEAANAKEAEEAAAEHQPDVVLVDFHLGGESCIPVSRRIRQRKPTTAIVVVTGASERDALGAALLAGAAAYLPKQVRRDFVGTVRAVARGERFFGAHSATGMIEHFRGSRTESTVGDEAGLLSLLAEGKTDVEIMQELDLDEGTLQRRVEHLVGAITSNRPYGSAVSGLSRRAGASD